MSYKIGVRESMLTISLALASVGPTATANAADIVDGSVGWLVQYAGCGCEGRRPR